MVDTAAPTGRALVVHPVQPVEAGVERPRSVEGRLAEAVGLAAAIRLEVVETAAPVLRQRKPATLFGTGQVERLHERIEATGAGIVVVDGALSPVQQRNLERAWNAKVIDRTGLILEIFGARARTHEGRLQVELAALTYQRSRLVRSWTHLERQRGGFGFLGGPGESQLEIDRRLIGDRIARLRRELDEVRRTRDLHRSARKRVPYPIVALVGYTNAGKSTLFNRLTRSEVFAQDLLFATLDPTMRALDLPSGRRVILSDTVGFISDLPTHLVAAFRATLEEVLEADLILHVVATDHPDAEAQRRDVEAVLTDLGLSTLVERGLTEVWNKIDALPEEERAARIEAASHAAQPCHPVSALSGEGVDRLLHWLDRHFASASSVVAIRAPHGDGRLLAWLHAHGDVRTRTDDETAATLTVALDPPNRARLEQLFPGAVVEQAV